MMNSLSLDVRTPAAPTVLDDNPRRELRLALLFGGLFFVGFLGWAAFTPLDAAAFARGIVEVSGNRQAVQHRDGGIVTALLVRDGDMVTRGQPLVHISSTDVEAEERGLTSQYLMLLAQRARLQAERSGIGTLTPPAEFAALKPADKLIADEALAGQRTLLQARLSSAAAQKSVLQQRSSQAEAQIQGYSAELEANAQQRRLIEQELAGMRELAEKGFASKTRIRALERQAAALGGAGGTTQAEIASTRQAMGENRMQALVIDRDLVETADEQLRDVVLQLNETLPKLMAARERLAQTIVRAPASGRVVGLTVFTVGGVVAQGQTLMEIVPQDRELVIKAQLSPDDADDVAAGQTTRVRFPTIRDREMPEITGTIATVSADSLLDERSGRRYFSAEVRVPARELAEIARPSDKTPPVRAGLPAEILIPLSDRSLLQYLLEPLVQSFWRTGREH